MRPALLLLLLAAIASSEDSVTGFYSWNYGDPFNRNFDPSFNVIEGKEKVLESGTKVFSVNIHKKDRPYTHSYRVSLRYYNNKLGMVEERISLPLADTSTLLNKLALQYQNDEIPKEISASKTSLIRLKQGVPIAVSRNNQTLNGEQIEVVLFLIVHEDRTIIKSN